MLIRKWRIRPTGEVSADEGPDGRRCAGLPLQPRGAGRVLSGVVRIEKNKAALDLKLAEHLPDLFLTR
jgi:hypothetical protein